MIPIKIQCGCGQRYAFDIEPVNGRMPSPVACPACGADGTDTANAILAQGLTEQLAIAPAFGLKINKAAMPTAHPIAPSSSSVPLPSPIRPPATQKPKLVWYEQIWIALPIALVAVGGAIGGACGGAAWAVNKNVFQKTENPILRYVWTGLISSSAVILWLIVTAFFLSLFKKH
jgi:hypothetical protein